MPEQKLFLDAGPFRVRIRSSEARFLDTLRFFYAANLRLDAAEVVDFDIRMLRPRSLRRWVRPQTLFEIDCRHVFDPHPAENAFAMYEWGLNWCIATSAHRYLMLHAGNVAFDDAALILPGNPGSGKSTLSAALTLRGARLLSDEFGLMRMETRDLVPMPRAIPLKNASIEAVLGFDADAALGPTYPRTRKGRVRHLRPDALSLEQQDRPATPRWLVFPNYVAGAVDQLRPMDRSEALRQLAFNCFNYKLLGEAAFRTVCAVVAEVDCYRMTFSNLDRATARLAALAGR